MPDFLMIGGPFGGKRMALPVDQQEQFVADLGTGERHRYARTTIEVDGAPEIVFVVDGVSLEDAIAMYRR